MKTPRLALLAFLALAAPYANAGSLPTWPVIEEGPRAWARVFFKVGTDSKTLRCRYNECKPEAKGVSNLYTITPVGTATPTKVTIYKLVPRSKWNPRYHTDGPYERVPEVINAKAQPYASELSHFKLDNTGAQLVVVQGGVKYPATTDISQAQYNSYDQLKVAPPTKMIDDVVRPAAPAPIGPPAPPRSGNPATVKWWCDPATGEKYSAARGRRGSTLLPSQSAECKKTAAPTPGGPVVTPPAPVETEASLALTEHELRWLTKEQAGNYPLARKKDAAATKTVDATYRALVEEQTRPEAKAKYAAAHALPPADAPKKIEEALAKVEMWGGEVKAVVGLFQEQPNAKLLEIQLSKEEYEALKKLPALKAYEEDRKGSSGSTAIRPDGTTGENEAFNADFLDPVQLRVTVVAARKALPKPAEGPAASKPELASGTPLTKDELALLTPRERMEYENRLAAVAKKEPGAEKALADMSDLLRKRIKDEGRKPEPAYAAPKNIEEFRKLPDWQKDKFCDPVTMGATAAKVDEATPGIDNRPDANAGLGSSAKGAENAATSGGIAVPASALPDWAQQPCALYLAGKNPRPNTPAAPREESSGIGNIGGGRGVTTGPDAVGKPVEEGNKWFTKPLVVTAIKGSLIGLLIGSLFGPIGLIAGPLLGAALFYGMTKYDEIKADKAKKNTPE